MCQHGVSRVCVRRGRVSCRRSASDVYLLRRACSCVLVCACVCTCVLWGGRVCWLNMMRAHMFLLEEIGCSFDLMSVDTMVG